MHTCKYISASKYTVNPGYSGPGPWAVFTSPQSVERVIISKFPCLRRQMRVASLASDVLQTSLDKLWWCLWPWINGQIRMMGFWIWTWIWRASTCWWRMAPQWWVQRHYGLFHANSKFYPLHLPFTAPPFPQAVDYKDLLVHSATGWFGKGNTLKRFCELRQEIVVFLRSSKLKKAGKLLSLKGLGDICRNYVLFSESAHSSLLIAVLGKCFISPH